VYELASAGLTDREVGCATALALKHVAEILTNAFYIGRLSSGSGACRRASRPRSARSARSSTPPPGSMSGVSGLGAAAATEDRSTAGSTAWAVCWRGLPAAVT
jgi:hypothetical protein